MKRALCPPEQLQREVQQMSASMQQMSTSMQHNQLNFLRQQLLLPPQLQQQHQVRSAVQTATLILYSIRALAA